MRLKPAAGDAALPYSNALTDREKFSYPAADAAISPTFIAKPENFISANPHFVKSALARYTPADFISLVEKHHIPYHEKTLGQLFCDRSAQDILGMLEKECADAGVHLLTQITIEEVSRSDNLSCALAKETFGRPFWWSPPEACRFRRPAPPTSGYRLARQFDVKVL